MPSTRTSAEGSAKKIVNTIAARDRAAGATSTRKGKRYDGKGKGRGSK